MKPAAYLAVAVAFLAFGVIGLLVAGATFFVVGLVVAAVCVPAYVLRTQVGLHVQNGGDRLHGLEFRRGVVDGVEVDVARVEDTIRIINWLVLRATSRSPEN